MSSEAPKNSDFLLKSVLQKLGISQRGLSRQIGATQDWVGRLATGKNDPKWITVLRIARALGVSVGVFVEGDPAREQLFGPTEQPGPATTRPSPAKSPAKARRQKTVA